MKHGDLLFAGLLGCIAGFACATFAMQIMRTCNVRMHTVFDNQPQVLDYATLSDSEHGAMHDTGDARPKGAAVFPVCVVLGKDEAEVGIGESVKMDDVQPEPLITVPKMAPQKSEGWQTDQP